MADLTRRALAEFIGTAVLLLGIVGSGIQAQRLTGDVGLQLLINVVGTVGVLITLILALGPRSGAHFNPVVTLADRVFGGLDTREALAYVGAQLGGAGSGAILANLMFDLDAVTWSTRSRDGWGPWLGEEIATFGLLLVIFGVVRSGRAEQAAYAVGAFIGAAMFFTSSTAFANPAVTLARTLTDSFTGIDPAHAPAFVVAQVLGAALAVGVIRVLYPDIDEFADVVLVPHGGDTDLAD